MRTFFKKLGDGVVTVSVSVAAYVGSTFVNAGAVLVAGARFIGAYVKASWNDAKASWAANHGVRAVLGFAVSLLIVPVAAAITVVAPIAVLAIGLVVMPILVGGLALGAIAFGVIVCLMAGLLAGIALLAGEIYKIEDGVEPQSTTAAEETIGEVVEGIAESAIA
jgi:hypothetical protein